VAAVGAADEETAVVALELVVMVVDDCKDFALPKTGEPGSPQMSFVLCNKTRLAGSERD
jgi:hypothetical protein